MVLYGCVSTASHHQIKSRRIL